MKSGRKSQAFKIRLDQAGQLKQQRIIQRAVALCAHKDEHSRSRITACVMALHLQYGTRSFNCVKSSLLKQFGKEWFPDVDDKVLRSALDVDPDLQDCLFRKIDKA